MNKAEEFLKRNCSPHTDNFGREDYLITPFQLEQYASKERREDMKIAFEAGNAYGGIRDESFNKWYDKWIKNQQHENK